MTLKPVRIRSNSVNALKHLSNDWQSTLEQFKIDAHHETRYSNLNKRMVFFSFFLSLLKDVCLRMKSSTWTIESRKFRPKLFISLHIYTKELNDNAVTIKKMSLSNESRCLSNHNKKRETYALGTDNRNGFQYDSVRFRCCWPIRFDSIRFTKATIVNMF